jgi:hypothetical protein
VTHGIQTLRHYKTAGPDHEADVTVGRCACGRFEVTIAGQKLTQAAEHLAFHLRKHGADQ